VFFYTFFEKIKKKLMQAGRGLEKGLLRANPGKSEPEKYAVESRK
jgi:hypothetical protein